MFLHSDKNEGKLKKLSMDASVSVKYEMSGREEGGVGGWKGKIITWLEEKTKII